MDEQDADSEVKKEAGFCLLLKTTMACTAETGGLASSSRVTTPFSLYLRHLSLALQLFLSLGLDGPSAQRGNWNGIRVQFPNRKCARSSPAARAQKAGVLLAGQ